MELSNDEIRRYSRHLILPEVGMAGQKKLKGTSVLCIGTGGLGSPISMYLAAAGIGRIGLVDFDVVDVIGDVHAADVGEADARARGHDLRDHAAEVALVAARDVERHGDVEVGGEVRRVNEIPGVYDKAGGAVVVDA